MAATIANQDKISLKVLVDKEKNKVIFAEADNNFVDALFSFMALPLGTIVRILGKSPDQRLNPIVSLQNLHKSLVELPECYLSAEEGKFMMLNPRTKLHECCRNLKLKIDDTEPTKYFICENEGCKASGSYFSNCSLARCYCCGKEMTREIKYQSILDFRIERFRYHGGGVLLPNLKTFIVTDDLFVMPNTLDLGLELLGDLGFTGTSHVEERTIDIGREQMIILLRAALVLKYPLTYMVFNIIHPIGTPAQHLTCNEEDKNSKTIKLKLTLQKSTSKFLFAEAGEDFVDFLFGFLEIPLGTLIGESMKDNTSLESLENLFDSISNMRYKEGCARWYYVKPMLIEPELVWKCVFENQIFPSRSSEIFTDITYYPPVLGDTTIRSENVSDESDHSSYKQTFKDPRVEGNFVKAGTKFMVTDDLTVTPLSTISAIAIMNKAKVPLKDLEYHVVTIGIEEGLNILNASLKSRSTLTDVLLGPIIEKKKRDDEELRSSSKKHGGSNVDPIIGLQRGKKRKKGKMARKLNHC